MKFYLYDETTKEYIGDQIGYIDPLETKLKGENVYLIPPYSTDIEPNLSELKDNEILVFNGSKWEIQEEFFVGKVVKNQSEKVLKYINDNGYILEQTENGFKICEPKPKSEAELEVEHTQQTINEIEAQLADMRERMVYAMLIGDDDLIQSIREEYSEVMHE